MVGASKDLREWRNGWSQEDLVSFGSEKQLEWKFITSNSQHQNGVIESIVKMIKGAKKAMFQVVGDKN